MGVSRMNKYRNEKFEKSFLKNYATISMFAFLWATTLFFYLLSRLYFGENIDFYHLGILAGLTGGLWGYGLNRIGQLRDIIKNKKPWHTVGSYRISLLFTTAVLIGSLLFDRYFKTILALLNLD